MYAVEGVIDHAKRSVIDEEVESKGEEADEDIGEV